MSKCLVTGGAGFIGSHIVDKLIDLGHEVLVIDNESSDNEKFYWHSKAKNFKGNITDLALMKDITIGVEYIFHCAAESRIGGTLNNPLKTIKSNVLGTSIVLECAKESNVKKIIYSSTSSVYGHNSVPNHEEQIDDCQNPYSESKFIGERLCKMYYEL